MPSPLYSKCYELMVRVASADVMQDDWRALKVYELMFRDALGLVSEIEDAVCAEDRQFFRYHLHDVHQSLRQVKLWLKLLDDLGRIAPEVAHPLHDAAEEVHRLVIAALHTSKLEDKGTPSKN